MDVFHLEIRQAAPGPDAYEVYARVGKKRVGPENVRFPVDNALRQRIDYLYERNDADRIPDAYEQESVCSEIGERLFASFVVGEVYDQYSHYRRELTNSPRLALYVPQPLYSLPWEVLRDPDDNLGSFFSVMGSLVRCDQRLANSGSQRVCTPVDTANVLYVYANPASQPLGRIELRRHDRLPIHEVKPATFDEFRKCVRSREGSASDARGLILYGHGDTDAGMYGRFHFVRLRDNIYEKDPRRADAISQHVCPSLRIAMLIACESGWIQTGSHFDFEKTLAGGLLTRTKLDFVVAMQQQIDFYAAKSFLDRMFESLIEQNVGLDIAVAHGRQAIREITPGSLGGRFSNLDWWIPVMYSKTTVFQLLSRPPELPSSSAVTPGEMLRKEPGRSIRWRGVWKAAKQSLGAFFQQDETQRWLDNPK